MVSSCRNIKIDLLASILLTLCLICGLLRHFADSTGPRRCESPNEDACSQSRDRGSFRLSCHVLSIENSHPAIEEKETASETHENGETGALYQQTVADNDYVEILHAHGRTPRFTHLRDSRSCQNSVVTSVTKYSNILQKDTSVSAIVVAHG